MIQKHEFKEFDFVIKSFYFIVPQSIVFKLHGIHCAEQIKFIRI